MYCVLIINDLTVIYEVRFETQITGVRLTVIYEVRFETQITGVRVTVIYEVRFETQITGVRVTVIYEVRFETQITGVRLTVIYEVRFETQITGVRVLLSLLVFWVVICRSLVVFFFLFRLAILLSVLCITASEHTFDLWYLQTCLAWQIHFTLIQEYCG